MCWIWDLILLYLLISALVVGLTHILYFYEIVNGPGLDWLRQKTRRSIPALLLQGFMQAYLAQLVVAVFYLPGFVKRLWFPAMAKDASTPPVILVHGLYHNASAWVFFRRRLQAAGFHNVYAISYWSFRANFFSISKKLEQRIEEAAQQCPGQGIYIVGHSLGGLLTRHYMATGARRKEVLAAVTLGAPHKGSRLAALGLGDLARSLIYKGDLAARLQQLDAPPPAPCLSLSSYSDEFVTPQSALQLGVDGWEERRGPCTPHVAMLFNGAVAREATTFLQEHGAGKAAE